MRYIGQRILLCLALGIATAVGSASAADSFVVIVHSANPVGSMTAREVSDLFLKKTMTWPTGTRVWPVDLSERSPVREAFSQSIHQKSTVAVKSHWLKMIFSGRSIPPPENSSAEEAVALVRSHPGGIGYVASGTPLGAGVRKLSIRP